MTKGWKANPVNYDHVLARAKYAWSFGAPEIVDLFSGPNVHGQHYSAEMIDFAASNTDILTLHTHWLCRGCKVVGPMVF